jgi:hypothetical protein
MNMDMIWIQYNTSLVYSNVFEHRKVSCRLSLADGQSIKKSISQHRKLTRVLTATTQTQNLLLLQACRASLPRVKIS